MTVRQVTRNPATPTSGRPVVGNVGAYDATRRSSLPALMPVAGTYQPTSGTAGAHTVIQNKQFNGWVDGTHSLHHVDFVNCWFRNLGGSGQALDIQTATASDLSVTFTDCTFGDVAGGGAENGIAGYGFAVLRGYWPDADDCIKADSGGWIEVTDSILDSGQSCSRSGTHGDCIQSDTGPCPHVQLRNSALIGGLSSCVFPQNISGGAATGWLFDGCWFYPGEGSAGATSYALADGTITGCVVTNSVFSNDFKPGAVAGVAGVSSMPRAAFGAWSGNTYEDGSIVSMPS